MILAISGSLRESSVNSAALRAAASAVARSAIVVAIDNSIAKLPQFNPDLEHALPPEVQRFRASCEGASGLLLSVPEYAFGIPGTFKNALDWTVRSGSLYQKPVTLLDVAPPGRGARAREALDHVLKALGADVARHSVPVSDADRDAQGEIVKPIVLDQLGAAVNALAARIALHRAV